MLKGLQSFTRGRGQNELCGNRLALELIGFVDGGRTYRRGSDAAGQRCQEHGSTKQKPPLIIFFRHGNSLCLIALMGVVTVLRS